MVPEGQNTLAFRLGKLQLLNPSKARQKLGTTPASICTAACPHIPETFLNIVLQHLLDFVLCKFLHAFNQPFYALSHILQHFTSLTSSQNSIWSTICRMKDAERLVIIPARVRSQISCHQRVGTGHRQKISSQ